MNLNIYIRFDFRIFYLYIFGIFLLQKTRTVSQIRSIKRKSTEKKYTVTEKIEVTRVSRNVHNSRTVNQIFIFATTLFRDSSEIIWFVATHFYNQNLV